MDFRSRWNNLSKTKVKFEDYEKSATKKLLFDNDLLDISYQYWETLDERATRLESMWLQARKARETKETNEAELHILYAEAVKKLRNIRWKLDQTLEKSGINPLFKEMYMSYTRDEFLLDSQVNFRKIKALFKHTRDEFSADPEIQQCALMIQTLLQKVGVIEDSSPGYYDSEGLYHWHAEKNIAKIIEDDFQQGSEEDGSGYQDIEEEKYQRDEERQERKELFEELRKEEEDMTDPYGGRHKKSASEERLQLINDLKGIAEAESVSKSAKKSPVPPGRPQRRKARLTLIKTLIKPIDKIEQAKAMEEKAKFESNIKD